MTKVAVCSESKEENDELEEQTKWEEEEGKVQILVEIKRETNLDQRACCDTNQLESLISQ